MFGRFWLKWGGVWGVAVGAGTVGGGDVVVARRRRGEFARSGAGDAGRWRGRYCPASDRVRPGGPSGAPAAWRGRLRCGGGGVRSPKRQQTIHRRGPGGSGWAGRRVPANGGSGDG